MTPPIDPAVAARAELATPFRYHLQPLPPPVEPWWQRAWDALNTFFTHLFSHVRGGRAAGEAIGDALIVAIVVLLLYLLARLVAVVAKRRMRAQTPAEALPSERDEHRLARESAAAAERGDVTLAVRLLFTAAVRLLDLRGALRDDASATVGELRRAVRPLGDVVATPFGEIASAYVMSVYAERPVDHEGWSRAYTAYRALQNRNA